MSPNPNINPNAKQVVLECVNVGKTFADNNLRVQVLQNVNLQIYAGDLTAVVGPSGSGKSTLLHVLGGLDTPTEGEVKICGASVRALSEKAKGDLRNKYLGFVYQFHHLLPEFTALENVAMPLLIGKMPIAEASERAENILARVGLSARLKHRSGELSGGERQRVALARALAANPKCVLADEPTGNLDHKTALQIYDLLMQLNAEFGTAFVIVTHDLAIAKRMQRTLTIEDGRLGEAVG